MVLVEEPDEFLASGRLLELADGLGFDLANTLSGDLEDMADLFEGVAISVAQAVAELDDLSLAIAERLLGSDEGWPVGKASGACAQEFMNQICH